ncbi:hypothetical protein DFH29DRAFT_881172 [Suillus ampliporus]|nr:hypothetical protein DFH29DRAFT_881172 [Suillus ampliporus]
MLIPNGTFYGCIAGDGNHMNVTTTTRCCNELGGKMLSANGSYGCAFVQNQFPATMQSVYAWDNCSINSTSACERPPSTGLPSGAISGAVSLNGRGIRGRLMIGILLLGVMAQMLLDIA